MRSISPRRRRAVILAASTSSISAAMLPMQHHLAHGRHEAAFGVVYIALIVTMLGFSLRELIKSRREEGCGKA